LTFGVPLDLPQTQAKSLEQDKTPLQLSVDVRARCSSPTPSGDGRPDTKLKAITRGRPRGTDERIYMRADQKADYGTVARVMGQLSGAGFNGWRWLTDQWSRDRSG